MNVRLVGHTTFSEQICAEAAKVCTSEQPYGMPKLMGADQVVKVLDHTIESGHESVVEHASFNFAIDGVSRALSHQLVRHRLASYSQQSQRYVELEYFKYVTPKSIEADEDILRRYVKLMRDISEFYTVAINNHVPAEDARYALPNACTTSLLMTMNARELLHFFELRMCNRAQSEIREMARLMYVECMMIAPAIFKHAGPNCWFDGCKEKKPCGMPKPSNPMDDVSIDGTLFC